MKRNALGRPRIRSIFNFKVKEISYIVHSILETSWNFDPT